LFSATFINAQNHKELADHYLSVRGELAFTFTANNFDEINQLSRIISFDHGNDRNNPLTIKAIANNKNFKQFLAFNLPFEVDKKLNDPKNVVMFNPKIHKKGVSSKNEAYTLTFPLTAYPTYAQYAQQMADFAADHPTIAELIDFGGTAEGVSDGDKRLLFIKLSDNVSTREKEPRVMYTSSMHGDEIAGFPMMLSLIDYFITAYNDTGHADHTRVKNLLDNSEVWINPLANPDGTYYNDATNTTVANAIRGNGNVIDLNRNYPAPEGALHPDGNAYQTETLNFMALAESTHFVIAANFHGGAEVVNYPWDFTYDRHPDDTWWQLVSKEYADNVQADALAHTTSDPNYFTDVTSTGYTHGADWYLIAGGRQDYMNFERQCREVTLEISSIKLIPEGQIETNWDYNREAVIDYLVQGTYGFQGVVKDAVSGLPINAKITLIESSVVHDDRGSWVETELPLGDYYRPINAGTYDILFEADCYQSYTLTNQIITDYQTIVLADVLLTPLVATIPTNLITSSITTTTTTIGWDDMGVTSYDVQYRENGSSTWTTTSSAVNSLNLTGLTINTTYEFQVRSVCLGIPSSYSGSTLFTTTSVTYCTSNGTTSFPTGITSVVFNTINNADTNNQDNAYEDYTGLTTDLDKSNTYNLEVKVNTDGNYRVHAFAWIDFNHDGDFNDVDEEYDLGLARNVTNGVTDTSPNITIPSGANLGATRMRIAAKYNSDPTSCETGFDGEVEDYTVNIIDSTLGIQDELLSEFVLYPNPVKDGEIKLSVPREITDFNVTISNVLGQKVYQKEVISNYNNLHKVNTSNFKQGIYFVTVSTNLGMATKKMIIQ